MSAEGLARHVTREGVRVVDGVRDLDQFIEILTRTTRPHAIIPRAGRFELHAQVDALVAGDIAFSRLSYGASVSVIPAEVDADTVLFPVSLSGAAQLRYGTDLLPIGSDGVTMIAPYREFRSDIDADYEQLLISAPRVLVESVAASLTGSPADAAVEPGLATWELSPASERVLEALALVAVDPVLREQQSLVSRLQAVAVESLLLGHPGFRALIPDESTPREKRVRDAKEYMQAHLAQPLTVGEVARAAGVTARALQSAFRSVEDRTPMQWLRERRLAAAFELLSAGAETVANVTSVAVACGFLHPGEFSMQFRRRYGRSPSEVLREARMSRARIR